MMIQSWQSWCKPLAVGIYLVMGGAFVFSGENALANSSCGPNGSWNDNGYCEYQDQDGVMKRCPQGQDGSWNCPSLDFDPRTVVARADTGEPIARELLEYLMLKLNLSLQDIQKLRQGDPKLVHLVKNFVQQNGIPLELRRGLNLSAPNLRHRLEPVTPRLRP